jgi:hypothetical protein
MSNILTSEQLDRLDNWFTYHAPFGSQLVRYEAIRNAGRQLATTIMLHTPDSEEQQQALMLLRQTIMMANAAIACGEKPEE